MKCEMCKKEFKTLNKHHTIPVWCGGIESEIMLVCNKCHGSADKLFDNLIKYGKFYSSFGKEGTKIYNKKFVRWKHLFSFNPILRVQYFDQLLYNIKTNCITITHSCILNKRGDNKIRR